MKIIIALALPLLGGCMAMGVQNMDAAQIRATEGMVTCVDVYTMYGKGRSVTVHADANKRGIESTNEIVVGADCTVTIRGSAAGAQGQPQPQPSVRTETTTTTKQVTEQPATPPKP